MVDSKFGIFGIILVILGITLASNAYSVIVVGAGPSGIAAATKLLENGVNVTILEAESRIGGRVNSVKFGDAFVDLGAQWCHGEENNIVYKLVKDLGILKSTNRDFEMVYSDGNTVEHEFAENICNFVGLYEELDRNTSDYYITIGDFFTQMYSKMMIEHLKNDTEKLEIAVNALDTLESFVCGFEGSFNWFKPTLNNPYEKCPGDLALNWDGHGYKTVLEVMMKKYPDPSKALDMEGRIHLNKVVTRIQWEGNADQVSVRCEDGSEYSADHVIFTPSIGVLKKKADYIFNPILPEKKQECIKALGLDAVMKVHLHFHDKWWPGEFIRRIFVWNHDEKATLSSKFSSLPRQESSSEEISWIGSIYHVLPAVNNPNVLTFWITGELIPEIETTPDREIIDGIWVVLNAFLGKKYNITMPDQIVHSSWYTNPNFHGTYSYETVESLKLGYNCHYELAESLKNSKGHPVLFFAGEATHPKYYSTVHGAIETGYREADKILAFHNEI